jgi:hypothetical protein
MAEMVSFQELHRGAANSLSSNPASSANVTFARGFNLAIAHSALLQWNKRAQREAVPKIAWWFAHIGYGMWFH